MIYVMGSMHNDVVGILRRPVFFAAACFSAQAYLCLGFVGFLRYGC